MWTILFVIAAIATALAVVLGRRWLIGRRLRQFRLTADTVTRLRRLEDGHG